MIFHFFPVTRNALFGRNADETRRATQKIGGKGNQTDPCITFLLFQVFRDSFTTGDMAVQTF